MGYRWSRDDTSIADGFRRILSEQADKAIAAAEDRHRSTARRIHEARRRGKKLRALLRLVRRDFPGAKHLGARIRDAAAHLSEARDAAVMRQTLEDLLEWAGRPRPAQPDAPVADETREAAILQHFGAEIRAISEDFGNWPTDRIDASTIERGLTATYRAGRAAGRHCARAGAVDTDFHEWRKLAKAHWYQLTLLRDCAGGLLGSEIKAASKLADLLGKHHDLAVLRQELASRPESLGETIDIAFVDGAALRLQHEIEREALELGARVFAERPKALRARFVAYVESWQHREAAE
jgi:CHAD domain-containing protein